MSEQNDKHTPGPWRIERRSEPHGDRDGLIDSIEPDVVSPLVMDYGGDWCLDVSDANAHLISAAPDLLAICREVWDAIGYTLTGDKEPMGKVQRETLYQELDAAIRKATGDTDA